MRPHIHSAHSLKHSVKSRHAQLLLFDHLQRAHQRLVLAYLAQIAIQGRSDRRQAALVDRLPRRYLLLEALPASLIRLLLICLLYTSPSPRD